LLGFELGFELISRVIFKSDFYLNFQDHETSLKVTDILRGAEPNRIVSPLAPLAGVIGTISTILECHPIRKPAGSG
jgi:hypothetical protein